MNEQRKGEWLVFANIFLWGLFPVTTYLSLAVLPSLVSYAWSTVCAALFFAVLVSARGTWRELASLQLWKYGAGVLLFIGILYYGFYFLGLGLTAPGNVAIIALFEIFTSFVFFHIIRREPMSRRHIVGAALMLIGALVILGRNFSGLNVGDLYILAATCVAPIGNLFQQKARTVASSETVMFLRTVTTVPAIFLLLFVFHIEGSVADLRGLLPLFILNGVLFFGLQKMLWIEAIHRISVTKAVALSSFAPLVTLVAAWFLLHQVPTWWQLFSLPPLVLGALFLTDQYRPLD